MPDLTPITPTERNALQQRLALIALKLGIDHTIHPDDSLETILIALLDRIATAIPDHEERILQLEADAAG